MTEWILNNPGDLPKLCILGTVGNKITSTKKAIGYIKDIADLSVECLVVITLRQDLTVVNARIAAIGSRIGATFCPANIFRGALLDDASEIIIIHNHPSGLVEPSKADKKVLKKLIKAGRLLDIVIRDSVIVSRGGKRYRSMME
jgi:DNA repair protein RadC